MVVKSAGWKVALKVVQLVVNSVARLADRSASKWVASLAALWGWMTVVRKVGSMAGRLAAMKVLQLAERMAEKWVEWLDT